MAGTADTIIERPASSHQLGLLQVLTDDNLAVVTLFRPRFPTCGTYLPFAWMAQMREHQLTGAGSLSDRGNLLYFDM